MANARQIKWKLESRKFIVELIGSPRNSLTPVRKETPSCCKSSDPIVADTAEDTLNERSVSQWATPL